MSANMWARIVMVQLAAALWLLLQFYFQIPPDEMHAAWFAILVMFVIGWPIGLLVGRLLANNADVDAIPFRVIAGANLVAWLVPVVGMLLSNMTLQFSKRSDTKRIYYWTLAAIGGWGAIANAGISGGNQFRFDQIQESCRAASPANWSREDIENFCLRGIKPTSR